MLDYKRLALYISVMIILLSLPVIASDTPYELSPVKEATLLGIGAALNITNYFIADYQSTPTQDDINSLSHNDVNWFDRSATYNWSSRYDTMSNVTRDVSFFMPLSLLFYESIRSDIFTISMLYIETWMLANGITDCLKSLTGRPRPYVYNEDVDDNVKLTRDAIRSFPSGHTTTAFFSTVFFATVFSDYYPQSQWKLPVWIASIGLATATGFFRYKAGKHYPTDIITGAVIGSAAGYGVPYIHRNTRCSVAIVPVSGSFGIVLMKEFD